MQTPLLLLQGAVVSVLALVFVVAPNTSSAFALLRDMSVILYMGIYLFMFASAIRLRRARPDRERPIKIRGLPVMGAVGMIAAVSAIVLGLTPPAGFSSTSPTVYALIVAGGVIILAVPPQIICRMRRPSWSDDPPAGGGPR